MNLKPRNENGQTAETGTPGTGHTQAVLVCGRGPILETRELRRRMWDAGRAGAYLDLPQGEAAARRRRPWCQVPVK